MIRQALFAIGLTAGAAQAEGLVPTAPILEACGGTQVTLDAVQVGEAIDPKALQRAEQVVSARLGGLYGATFDYTHVEGTQIIVSLPVAFQADVDALAPLFEQVDFGFHDVVQHSSSDGAALEAGQVMLPSRDWPDVNYVVGIVPVLDGTAVRDVQATLDYNNVPAVSFRFTDEAAPVFGQYTSDNIGNMFAIVVRDEVVTAPTILSAIWGGSGIITGSFTVQEAEELAIVLGSGLLPFDLDVSFSETMDGSDPSAAFCP